MIKHFNTTHGLTRTKFYKTYYSIHKRCNNISYEYYHRYGGRGIKNKWNSFKEFYNDMYESYKKHINEYGEKNTSIDRIDNNGDYCKENCKWSTRKEQARNRTGRCRKITYNGVTKTLSAWSEDLEIKSSTIRMRLTYGRSIEKALGFKD